ncbi:MAG: carbohydrate ABC transporter permease [Clostridia bacterium]|nr:carbohydrate ABC transporter permease [Clostridia bacterium]
MRTTRSEKIFYAVNYVILTLGAMICLLPFLHVASQSLSSYRANTSGMVGIVPVEFNVDAYKQLFQGTRILPALFNSVKITVVGTVLSMLCSVMAAYPLSRKHFWGRKFFMKAIVFTMLFNGGMIPTYLNMRSLGLVNSYGALWMLNLINPYNMIILRSFFEEMPQELIDAAKIDGCTEMQTLWYIILPLSLPVLVTVGMFYLIWYWDLFQGVLIYITDTKKYNLVVLVNQLINQNDILDKLNRRSSSAMAVQIAPEMIRAAGIMVMVIPMVCIYPFLQKYFVKGVMIGSVKG